MDRRWRRTFATALFLYLAFIVYGTLIPFDITLDPGLEQGQWQQVDRSLFFHPGEGISLPDLVSNLLLFIPLGFLVYASLGHDQARAIPKVLAGLALGFFLSLSVETCQLFTRDRTASLDDVTMNSMGALVGGALAAVFFRSRFQRLVGFIQPNLGRQPGALFLGLYLFILAIDSMVPFDVSVDVSSLKEHLKAVNIMPFGYRTLWGSSKGGDFLWVNFIGDALSALPFGFLLCSCYCQYWRDKKGRLMGILCLGGLSHLFIEVGQLLIASRVSDVNDVLSGLLGTAWGAAAFALVCGTRGERGKVGLGSKPIYLSLMAVDLGLMGFSALKPFVFSFDPGFLAERLSSSNLMPLLPYFHKTSFGALEDLVKTFLYPLPLGYILGLQWQAKGVSETIKEDPHV